MADVLLWCWCVHASVCSTRVLSSSGQLGVHKVDKPHVTEPKPFHLRSDSRARVRRSHEQPTIQQAAAAAGQFKAQPLNRSILDGPVCSPVQAFAVCCLLSYLKPASSRTCLQGVAKKSLLSRMFSGTLFQPLILRAPTP